MKVPYLNQLLTSIYNESNMEILSQNQPTPLVNIEMQTFLNLNLDHLKLKDYKSVDKEGLKKSLRDTLDKELVVVFESCLKELKDKSLPVGIQKDALLIPIYAEEIFSDPTRKLWSLELNLFSIFSAIGFRTFGVWIGKRSF